MLEHYLASVYRWTCDTCGYHRTDTGVENTSLIQARHICEDNMTGKPVILSCWEELDILMDRIKDPAEVDRDGAIAEARGAAKILVKWTAPHYRTTQDISREALRRWTARQQGEDPYTLGTVVAQASADLAVSLGTRTGTAAPAVRTPRPAPSKQFTQEEVTAIKNGHSMGFSLKDLATAFKCQESNISAVLAS